MNTEETKLDAQGNSINPMLAESLPAELNHEAQMWKEEYDGACREIKSLMEQLKDAEDHIRDLESELRSGR